MLRRLYLWMALAGAVAALLAAPSAGKPVVVTGEIRGAIGPASAAYTTRLLAEARQRDAALVVLALDTPGGLDTAMREMIRDILTSPVPVAIFVSPQGARAASAGTYLLYASHVAAMAPGTNVGAATPIAIGLGPDRDTPTGGTPKGKGDAKDDAGKREPADPAKAKAVNDAAAYLRSLAQMRGRNEAWAEQAVRDAVSLSANEALAQHVIDVVAVDVPDLFRQIEGRRVAAAAGPRTLALAGAERIAVEPRWKEVVLGRIADPNIALILLMIGVYGLLFEFYSPGMALPGVVGAIALLLGFYGLAMLSVDFAGVALIVLGLVLMVAEAFAPSFGALGLGGIAAFALGAMFLVDDAVPGFEIAWGLVMPLLAITALGLAALGAFALRARRGPSVSGVEGMVGSRVRAMEDIDREGWVWTHGERWRGRTPTPLRSGAWARIAAVDGLTLVLEPLDEGETR